MWEDLERPVQELQIRLWQEGAAKMVVWKHSYPPPVGCVGGDKAGKGGVRFKAYASA